METIENLKMKNLELSVLKEDIGWVRLELWNIRDTKNRIEKLEKELEWNIRKFAAISPITKEDKDRIMKDKDRIISKYIKEMKEAKIALNRSEESMKKYSIHIKCRDVIIKVRYEDMIIQTDENK